MLCLGWHLLDGKFLFFSFSPFTFNKKAAIGCVCACALESVCMCLRSISTPWSRFRRQLALHLSLSPPSRLHFSTNPSRSRLEGQTCPLPPVRLCRSLLLLLPGNFRLCQTRHFVSRPLRLFSSQRLLFHSVQEAGRRKRLLHDGSQAQSRDFQVINFSQRFYIGFADVKWLSDFVNMFFLWIKESFTLTIRFQLCFSIQDRWCLWRNSRRTYWLGMDCVGISQHKGFAFENMFQTN